VQVQVSTKDGSTRWAEVNASLMRAEDGTPVGITGVTRDTTERKQAEDLLQRSEEKFRRIARANAH